MVSNKEGQDLTNKKELGHSLFFATGIALFSSLLISIYVLAVVRIANRVPLNSIYQEATENAAIAAANDLAVLTVDTTRFGRLGLINLDKEQGFAYGLNTLYATLRLNTFLAKRLHLPYISQLIDEDLQILDTAQSELAKLLHESVKNHSIYQHAYEVACRGKNLGKEKLVDLKITLGTTSDKNFFASKAIPINNKLIYFYPLAKKIRLAKVEYFQTTNKNILPSVVLVEATYKEKSASEERETIIKRSACAVVQIKDVQMPKSAFMFSFPHGIPAKCQSILQTIANASDKNSYGWQQAKAGAVPGPGHLNPTWGLNTNTFNHSPQNAIIMSLYHWLITLGPSIDLDSAEKIFNQNFVAAKSIKKQDFSGIHYNSALVRDTGIRKALFYECEPDSIGQEMLKQAFSGKYSNNYFPSSAIPLFIDEKGNCNLPGHNGFDLQLAIDFTNSLHQTNISSIEISSQAKSLLNKLNKKSKKETQLIHTINLIAQNADKAAFNSFELCKRLSENTCKGILRHKETNGFLLNSDKIFTPIMFALSENEILEIAQKKENKFNFWTDKNFSIIQSISNPTKSFIPQSASPTFFVIKSQELIGKELPNLIVLNFSPFSNSGITEKELMYYADNGIYTGGNPIVSWSILVRDLAAVEAGNPNNLTRSLIGQWCHQNQGAFINDINCPSLAAEVQIRSPLPVLPNLPIGSYLSSPILSNEKVSPLPPLPASMI